MTTSRTDADAPVTSPTLTEIFAALANEDRLTIVRVMMPTGLERCALTITEIARTAELSRFAASRHLRVLIACGIVEVAARGRCRLHRLRSDAFAPIEDWLYPVIDSIECASERGSADGRFLTDEGFRAHVA